MFELTAPWWDPLVRAVLVYAALLVLVRVSGRRTVGQFTPFDLLVVMLLSESASSALNGGDNSVTGGLLQAATLVALNLGIATLTSCNKRTLALMEGRPVLIGGEGRFYPEVMRAYRLSLADGYQALREADCELGDMTAAVLETDGTISILKKAMWHGDVDNPC